MQTQILQFAQIFDAGKSQILINQNNQTEKFVKRLTNHTIPNFHRPNVKKYTYIRFHTIKHLK